MQQNKRAARIEAVRRFSRFYTRRIGVLRSRLLDSPFTLAEARVIYELAHQPGTSPGALASQLEVDPGYLSRIVKRLGERGILDRRRADHDGRQAVLELTEAGMAAFADLDARSRGQIADFLGPLPAADQDRVVDAMDTIESLLGAPAEPRVPYIIRPPEPGDMGWVISRHGALYAREYGFDASFEGLVAEIAGQFAVSHDPARERCWIAEREGVPVGSVFVMRKSDAVAKLRLLIVDPSARGLGIGHRLVAECLRFGRDRDYRRMTLWTQANLTSAIHIYRRAGFRLTAEEPHHSFGQDLVGQTWDIDL